MRDSSFYLRKAAQQAGSIAVDKGASGYLSSPAPTLDPHIFDGTHLRPGVRAHILNVLYDFWARKYKNARLWSTVWLAGSGASYQWAANRGNGDLDILIGVNWAQFVNANPEYDGLTPQQIADRIDLDLKTELWPRTAHTAFNGQVYEVTYYVNAAGSDIRQINAYAAYDLTSDTWTIRPPALPSRPSTLYPTAYYKAVAGESRTASDLVSRYNALSNTLKATHPGTPGHVNASSGLHQVTSQARAMFNDIHLGRHAAFAPGGHGYADWANFRWQLHKRNGTAQALDAIAHVETSAETAYAKHTYGTSLDTADNLITRAVLLSRGIR